MGTIICAQMKNPVCHCSPQNMETIVPCHWQGTNKTFDAGGAANTPRQRKTATTCRCDFKHQLSTVLFEIDHMASDLAKPPTARRRPVGILLRPLRVPLLPRLVNGGSCIFTYRGQGIGQHMVQSMAQKAVQGSVVLHMQQLWVPVWASACLNAWVNGSLNRSLHGSMCVSAHLGDGPLRAPMHGTKGPWIRFNMADCACPSLKLGPCRSVHHGLMLHAERNAWAN